MGAWVVVSAGWYEIAKTAERAAKRNAWSNGCQRRSLNVSLALETARFSKGLADADRTLKKHFDRMEDMGKRIGQSLRAIGSVAITAGIGMAANALRDMAKKGPETASSLGEQEQQLGVTTSELQRYRFIASQVGIDQEVMDKGLAKLSSIRRRNRGTLSSGSGSRRR